VKRRRSHAPARALGGSTSTLLGRRSVRVCIYIYEHISKRALGRRCRFARYLTSFFIRITIISTDATLAIAVAVIIATAAVAVIIATAAATHTRTDRGRPQDRPPPPSACIFPRLLLCLRAAIAALSSPLTPHPA